MNVTLFLQNDDAQKRIVQKFKKTKKLFTLIFNFKQSVINQVYKQKNFNVEETPCYVKTFKLQASLKRLYCYVPMQCIYLWIHNVTLE